MNGLMMLEVEEAMNGILTTISMRESSKVVRLTAREYTPGPMARSMMESGKME